MLICSQAWQIQVVSPSTNVCIWVEVQTWALDCGVQTKTEALEWLEERWGQTQMPSQALNCATFCQNTSGSMLSLFFCCWSKKKNHPEQGPGDTQAGSCHCRNDFNTPPQKGSALPSFLSWTSSLVWPWTAESSWPCISSGSYEPLFRSPVMLHSVIQSPFTSFLCLPLYMNFSVLSAITPRWCLYLSAQQCQETFARLDLSCLSCLIVSAGSAPGCGWKRLGLSLTVQE